MPRNLAARWPRWGAGVGRRANARKKLDLYGERHLQRVRRVIVERVDEDSADEVLAFASRSPNLLRAVADAVAVCYRQGCRRELRNLGDAASRAFAEVVAESGIDRRASGLNAHAWLLGPTIVTPCLDPRGRVALDIITADRDDVRGAGDYLEAVIWRRDDGVWIELDGGAWRYYAPNGAELEVMPHYVGHCPAVAFRADEPTLDWWATDEHMGLADAGLDVAYKLALGLWTRQVSSNQLAVVFANIDGVPPGQTISSPSKPLVLPPKNQGADLAVHDRAVDPKEYITEIQSLVALAAARYGILPSDIVFQPGTTDTLAIGTGASISIRGERLGVLRDRQVPWLRHAEAELWPIVCDFLRGSTHRHARVLPPGDEVRDALRIIFPDLASPAERKARIEALELEVKFGLSSPVDVLLAARPELTRAEAEEEIDANRLAEIKRTELLAARNQPAELGQVPESIAQLHGRIGGQQSGAVRREENDDQP